MHAIPEKLSALRQGLEATMIRQNVETRQEFEKRLREACKDAEDAALQRAEELIVPQMRATSERLQGLIQVVQMRAEEAFPKMAEVQDQLNSTRAEVQPLHHRADAASARLDRVAVEASTTSKDCLDLSQDFKSIVADLRNKLAEETRNREKMEDRLKTMLDNATKENNRIAHAASDKVDAQAKSVQSQMADLEERFSRRLDEVGQRIFKEWKLGDQELSNRLRLDIQAVSQLVQKRSDENQEHAEGIVRNAVSALRGELESTSNRLSSSSEKSMEQKARDLVAKMNEGFEAATCRCEHIRDSCSTSLQEACAALRKDVGAIRNGLSNETQTLRQLITAAETRTMQGVEECERRTLDASSKRLQDTALDLRRELGEAKRSLLDCDDALRQQCQDQVDKTIAKLEQTIQEAVSVAGTSSTLALGQAVTQMQSELADALKATNESIDSVRCIAADALNKEVLGRKEAIAVAQASRDQLNVSLREEIKSVSSETLRSAAALASQVDRRVDAAADAIRTLEGTSETMVKDLADTSASLRKQLKNERQLTEEMGSDRLQLIQEVRDNLESNLQTVSADLQQCLAEARKKIYEEANTLRAELREQPTKRELVELASTTTEQYNELNNALASNRARLEAAVADHGAKVREARSEFNEARLRMQRESMALGGELTTLRSASSSLANGVIKSLQVLGFIRDEIETKRTIESNEVADTKNENRGIEIGDLLEWEKVGKSLATRVARQWHAKESVGIPNVMYLVEGKANTEDLVVLRTLIKELAPSTWVTTLNETGLSTASTVAPPTAPSSPKPGSPPPGVTKAREQRLLDSTAHTLRTMTGER